MQILLVRNAWLKANDREEDGRLIPELQPFNEQLEKIEPSAMRKFVKPFDMSINPEDPENLASISFCLSIAHPILVTLPFSCSTSTL